MIDLKSYLKYINIINHIIQIIHLNNLIHQGTFLFFLIYHLLLRFFINLNFIQLFLY